MAHTNPDIHRAEHPKFLAHHFETPRQQYESGKTGMWLFLSTEILLFSGLFCAYAVYRSSHPEIFVYADRFLDKRLGGLNTLILITSSLTAAWAVRAAQLNQRKKLISLIIVTLICACGFLGVKGIEYHSKWKHGLLWGQRFQPHGEEGMLEAKPTTAPPQYLVAIPPPNKDADPMTVRTAIPPPAQAPAGLAAPETAIPAGAAGEGVAFPVRPRNVQIFFSIYFIMTGLHGLHVLAGMSAFGWVLRRAVRGDFSSEYYTPVDLVALYWHLVDLIWIFLFPLLYLIH